MRKKKKGNKIFFKTVLSGLFQEYKKKMRLNKSWNINFHIKNKKDHYAYVEYNYKDRNFDVIISDQMNETVNSLRDSVIHEFWHILLSPFRYRIEKELNKIDIGKRIDTDKIRGWLEKEEERMVRKFTKIIKDLDKND